MSDLRRYIIRYGAKYMESFESDLYYDCNSVGKMKDGDCVFWFVSATHTHLYSAKEIRESHLNLETLLGNRANYRIDCGTSRFNEPEFALTKVGDFEVRELVEG